MIYRRPFLIATMFAEVVWLAPVTLAATVQQQDPGVRLFAENCAACHGTFGEGGSGPDLTNILWQSEVSDSDLDRIIGNGVRGTTMPAFGGKLDASARQALIRQIRTLKAEHPARTLCGVLLVEHIGDIIACEPIVGWLRRTVPDALAVWVVRDVYR